MKIKTIFVDAWNTFVTEQGVNKEMKQLLDSYSNPKIIVTNANNEQIQKLGIVNMPYPVFSLSHNPKKTDPTYFERLLSEKGLLVSEVVYFEHNEEAVNSAKSLGIETLWFKKGSELKLLEFFLKEKI